MSTSNFETCENCDNNSALTECKECSQRMCRFCFDKHVFDISKLSQHYVNTSGDICKIHKMCKTVSFCNSCSQLLCDLCKQGHETHEGYILDLTVAVRKLKENIQKTIGDFKNKISEADRYINSFPEKSKQINAKKAESQKVESRLYNEYKNFIDIRCENLEGFKTFLTTKIENLRALEQQTNPYVCLSVWLGITEEVKQSKKKLREDDDKEAVFAEKCGISQQPKIFDSENMQLGVAATRKIQKETSSMEDVNDPGEKTEYVAANHKLKEHISSGEAVDKLAEKTDELIKAHLNMVYESANQFHSSVLRLTRKNCPSDILPLSDPHAFTKMTEFAGKVLTDMHNQLDSYKNEVKSLQNEVAKMKKAKEKMEKALAENQKREETEGTVADIQQLKISTVELKNKLTVQQNENVELKDRATKLNDKLSEKVNEIKRHKQTQRRIENDIKARDNTLKSLSSQLVQSNKRATDLNDKLQEKVNKIKQYEQNQKQIEKELEEGETSLKSLSSQLEQSQKRENELSQKCIKSDTDVNELKQLIETRKNKETDCVLTAISEATQTERSEGYTCIEDTDCKVVALEQLRQSNFYKQKLEVLRKENVDLKDRGTSEVVIERHQSTIDGLTRVQNELKEENGQLRKRAKDFENLFNEKENAINRLEKQLKQTEQDLCGHKTNYQNLSHQLEQSELRRTEAQKTLVKYSSDIEKKDRMINDLKKKYQQIEADKNKAERETNRKLQLAQIELEQRFKKMTEMEDAIKSLKSEKDDLQTRLSSFAGDKLTRGNPAITDLADPNRPMKIGERYGELYDNDWTDAMEKVDTIKKCFPDKEELEAEEIMIHHLHRIVRCCYQGCSELAIRQVNQVVTAIGLNPDETNANTDVSGFKELMESRLRKADQFAKQLALQKEFRDTLLDKWDYAFKHRDVMTEIISSPFYEKCVELCWYMAIQDPAMCLDDDIPPGTGMDKNIYKEFTKSGETVVYVVWPALYLHKDGPLLYKGVVQVK